MGLTKWLICIIASIGFAFDIYELLMLPLIIKPLIASLSEPLVQELITGGMSPAEANALWMPGGEMYGKWARTLFFVPALVGGIFGLLGGYLTDRFGRRRILTYSILLYAFSAFAAGALVETLPQLLFFRCLVFIGVCVEFVAAVAWLAELFTEPKQREKVLGYTQAFSSIGGFLVAVANYYAATHALSLPEIHGGHEAWRYTLISGVLPALPLILIRPFLPESPAWAKKKAAGTLRRPNIRELFSPELARTTVVTTLIFAASYGIAFGAIQQLPHILAWPRGHVEIKAIAGAAEEAAKTALIETAESEGKAAPSEEELIEVGKQAGRNASDKQTATVAKWQEIGGLLGRLVFAILAVWIVSRRTMLRIFLIPAAILTPLYFLWVGSNLGTEGSLAMVKWGIFFVALFTVAQFSFWGNYIPLVFPVHLRGTGESFAANIGGRILGTAAAFITLTLSAGQSVTALAKYAAIVGGGYALIGVILTFWLPEPKKELLEE
ncbi:MAG: MFS transporter [Verrucomicrobiaceae bacterium]|nr:MFS transporter [Verrucomicrobiaceae bacterium]